MDSTLRHAILDTLNGRSPVLCVLHGSMLYGTETPGSDRDVRVVYLPSADDILLGAVDTMRTNNPNQTPMSAGQADVQAFSLARFLRLLGEGDLHTAEVLYAPPSHHVLPEDPAVMGMVRDHAARLFAMGATSPLRHARDMVGPLAPDLEDRTATLCAGIDAITRAMGHTDPTARLHTIPSLLAELGALPGVTWKATTTGGERVESIPAAACGCGTWTGHTLFLAFHDRMIPTTASLETSLATLESSRARLARARSKMDKGTASTPKDIYHAVRMLEEYTELATTGRLTLPRPEAPTLRAIRAGGMQGEDLRRIVAQAFARAQAAKIAPKAFGAAPDAACARGILLHHHRRVVMDGAP